MSVFDNLNADDLYPLRSDPFVKKLSSTVIVRICKSGDLKTIRLAGKIFVTKQWVLEFIEKSTNKELSFQMKSTSRKNKVLEAEQESKQITRAKTKRASNSREG
jgi:hypothetical protein